MLNVQEAQAKEPLQGRGCAVQTVRPSEAPAWRRSVRGDPGGGEAVMMRTEAGSGRRASSETISRGDSRR